jgi:CRISPR-associated protein Cmx8
MTRDRSEEAALVARVHRLVTAYVLRKTEAKTGISWEAVKGKRTGKGRRGEGRWDVPPRYRAAREQVCREAFLRLRACRSRADFLAYFTGTLCAVPQVLPEAEYQVLAAALLSDTLWEDVKALSMLALSGVSRLG